MEKIVLQKYIASAGVCSRRKAEEFIRQGVVFMNGIVAELGQTVKDGDEVKVNGTIVEPQEKVYIIMNKPIGTVCTNAKFKNEENVFAFLPKKYHSLHIVGRLDKDSRGLVLLTNDGDFTMKATHPRFMHEKKYIIELQNNKKRNVAEIKNSFLRGVDIGEERLAKAKSIKYMNDNKFELVLIEGRNRQIRKMFGIFEERIVDLERVSLGKVELGDVKEGEWKNIKINFDD